MIGAVKEFHARNLINRITPSAYALDPDRFRIISVKTRPGTLLSTVDHLKEVLGQYITNRPLHYYFLDDRLDRAYSNKRLATYTAERRTKKIGIRKALGASIPSIVGLLSLESPGRLGESQLRCRETEAHQGR